MNALTPKARAEIYADKQGTNGSVNWDRAYTAYLNGYVAAIEDAIKIAQAETDAMQENLKNHLYKKVDNCNGFN